MGLKETVKRLETTTCATETCLICESTFVYQKVFEAELARLGVRRDVRAEDCTARACFECGRPQMIDFADYTAEMRRKWLELTDEIHHLLQVRDITAQHRLRKMCDELDELLKTKNERIFHGTKTDAIRQAGAKASAVMLAWIDQHGEELTRMMRRPALITRRGFAA